MISLTIWICLWSIVFVLAPPLLTVNHDQSLQNFAMTTSGLLKTNSKTLIKRRKIKANHTTTAIKSYNFDINSYRSSWGFIDKHTIRVRFRLDQFLINSIVSTRFLVRHLHTGQIQTYDEPHEIVNSTLSLYLHTMKHGRHMVCLLLYRSKLKKNPRHVLCQDIVFNFHRYGHLDMDSDEHGNTFFFLLTQYSIVLGMLCVLQIVHTIRKRRFLQAISQKAHDLTKLMAEYHHHKPTTDPNQESHALEYLIYNLNRNALGNIDQMYLSTPNEDEMNNLPESVRPRIALEKHLKIPTRLSRHSIKPLVGGRRRLTSISNNLDEDESDFYTRSHDEQSVSFKCASHILEENKPWVAKLADNGNIEHAVISPEYLQNTRVHNV